MQPLRDIVLIRADQAKTATDSGILLSENWKTLPMLGEVLAIGPDVKTVKPGDRISFGRYGTLILENDERLCKEAHIFAVMEKNV